MHVITGLTTGGAEMMLLKLLSENKNKGNWEPIVVSPMDEGTIGPRISELGIPVYCLSMRPPVPNPVRAFYLISITRKFRPQIIQGWMYHGNLMASFARVFLGTPVPVFWNIRQSLEDVASYGQRTAIIIRLGALLSRCPTAIIYNSQTGARGHCAFGYRNGIEVVIPNGIDCQTFHPDEAARRQVRGQLGVDDNAILVGLIARYHPMKDHAGYLRAASLVMQAHPEARFLLAGKGLTSDGPTIMKLIAKLQLEGRIFLLGERSDIPRLTAALDIACSASAWGEGFSNAIAEAMACGAPCVVTDVGDSAQIVAETGLIVPPQEPEELARAISYLIEVGPEHRRRLGAASRRHIQSEFSLSKIAFRYDDLYKKHLADLCNL